MKYKTIITISSLIIISLNLFSQDKTSVYIWNFPSDGFENESLQEKVEGVISNTISSCNEYNVIYNREFRTKNYNDVTDIIVITNEMKDIIERAVRKRHLSQVEIHKLEEFKKNDLNFIIITGKIIYNRESRDRFDAYNIHIEVINPYDNFRYENDYLNFSYKDIENKAIISRKVLKFLATRGKLCTFQEELDKISNEPKKEKINRFVELEWILKDETNNLIHKSKELIESDEDLYAIYLNAKIKYYTDLVSSMFESLSLEEKKDSIKEIIFAMEQSNRLLKSEEKSNNEERKNFKHLIKQYKEMLNKLEGLK